MGTHKQGQRDVRSSRACRSIASIATAVGLVLALTGASQAPSATTASPLPVPPPYPAAGPGTQIGGVVFTAPGHGFIVSGNSPGSDDASGTAGVKATADDGSSWTTVWRQKGAALGWVGEAGGTVVAAGVFDGTRPLLVQTKDNGRSWQVVHPRVDAGPLPQGWTSPVGQFTTALWASDQFDFVSEQVGFALPDVMDGQAHEGLPQRILRTEDGGREWSPVAFPGGSPTGGLAFSTSQKGFATGTTTTASCLSQLWATTDGGTVWAKVAGTCVPYWLNGISFPTRSEGFAVGGNWAMYAGEEQLDVLATADGGLHWRLAFAAREPADPTNDLGPLAEVLFASPTRGYALVGGQVASGNGPLGGHLWTTADGGRHWRATTAEGLRLALDGRSGLWLAGGLGGTSDLLLHSTDDAATWSTVADAPDLNVYGLSAYGAEVAVLTEAGIFLSADGGGRWASSPPALAAAATRGSNGPDFGLSVGPGGLMVVSDIGAAGFWLSDNYGRTGSYTQIGPLARLGLDAVAFEDAKDGLAVGDGTCAVPSAVFSTTDGGKTWARQPELAMTVGSLSYAGANVVAAGWGCDDNQVDVSSDGGHLWEAHATGDPCGEPSGNAEMISVSCTTLNDPGEAYALVSNDEGAQWEQWALGQDRPSGPDDTLVVNGAAGAGYWAFGPPGTLWHRGTANAVWIALRPKFPVKA